MSFSDRWYREATVPLAAEEIAALLNGVIAGASFAPGLRGGSEEPQAKMDDADECPRCRGTKHTKIGDRQKCQNCKKFFSAAEEIANLVTPAEEIAGLFAGNPHDVSGEARDKGQFAKTPGAGAGKPEPTGSPLDPATGAKPPPKPHEIHKQNMDYHNKAAKAMQSMVKQHLDLAKVALSPEDRQQHIEQARQMKQLASTHVTEAGKHATKMSEALKQAAAAQPPAAGAMPGAAPAPGTVMPNEPWGAPPNSVKTLPTMPRDTHTTGASVKPQPDMSQYGKPKQQPEQPVKVQEATGWAANEKAPISPGQATRADAPAVRRDQERAEAQRVQRGPLDPKKLEEARRTRDATNAAMGQPSDPALNPAQEAHRKMIEAARTGTAQQHDAATQAWEREHVRGVQGSPAARAEQQTNQANQIKAQPTPAWPPPALTPKPRPNYPSAKPSGPKNRPPGKGL